MNNHHKLSRSLECYVIELYEQPDMLITYENYSAGVRHDWGKIKKDE